MPPPLIQTSVISEASRVDPVDDAVGHGAYPTLAPTSLDVSAGRRRPYARQDQAVHRVNAPMSRPPDSGQYPPEPIIRSLFDPGRTRHPSQAYTVYRAFPSGPVWQEDRFNARELATSKHEFVDPLASKPSGRFFDWAALRRNLPRDYPESYGEQVAMFDEETRTYPEGNVYRA